MSDEYTKVCVLRRCGQLDGNPACCKRMKRNQYNIEYNDVINAFYPVGDRIDLRRIVLDHLWTSIKKEDCAQFHMLRCVSRRFCNDEQSYCYPIPLRDKRVNRIVCVMFAYYCADQAQNTADAAAADAAAADAATYAAARAAAAAAREKFYREASVELIRLIDAWGDTLQ